MKSLFQKALLVFFTAIISLNLAAQDKKVDVDINVGKGHVWYQQPWAWIVGAAVFILLLVAILRPRDRSGA